MSTKQRLFEIIGKIDSNFNIPINKQLINRIPFLKEYNIFENTPDSIDAQKIRNNSNVTIFIGDQMITFKQYNLVSEFHYSKRQIHDNIFYNFSVKNSFYYDIPKELNDLTLTIYIHVIKILAEKLSYRKEIRLKEDEIFNAATLTQIINEINKNIYEFEEYATEHKLKF